jgi:hypothetical protein
VLRPLIYPQLVIIFLPAASFVPPSACAWHPQYASVLQETTGVCVCGGSALRPILYAPLILGVPAHVW